MRQAGDAAMWQSGTPGERSALRNLCGLSDRSIDVAAAAEREDGLASVGSSMAGSFPAANQRPP
jgi:hypothetical protein